MRRPVNSPYSIETEFGVPDSNALFKYHSGVDYGVASGSNVYAPASGEVTYAQYHNVRGNMVGIFDGKYTHRLMHNSSFKVKVGQKVNEGDLVALSGSTGLSTGPHVHWDILSGNRMDANAFSDFVDPFEAMKTPAPAPAPVQDVLESYQRRVRSDDSINYRDAPNRNGNLIETWPVNDVANFKGWVRGETVDGNNIWFVGRFSGGYAWSGGFTDTSTTGLADLNQAAPVSPPVVTPPTPAFQYDKKPATAGTWGIDVSSHQKSLDFKLLKEQGVEIAVIKAGHTGASYGGNATKTDPTLYTFQRDARANGVAVGYYWYCYFDEDAETEAARFVQSVGTRTGSEPYFADVEEVNGANKDWLLCFIETVEELTGSLCHIYTYSNYLQNHPWIYELLGARKLWLAHYDIPAGAAVGDYIMHQYTSKGVLKGVTSTYIDLNLFMGSVDQFKTLGDVVPVLTPPLPVPEDKDPLPVENPPAPLPTKDNNPVRPKVKAGAIAGIVVTALIAFANLFGIQLGPDAEGAALTLVSGLVTLVTFLAAYFKTDGLSPK